MRKSILSIFALLVFSNAFSQVSDSLIINKIFIESLSNGRAYHNLERLCKDVGARLSGSAAAEKAVTWTAKTMKEMGADTVYLQEVMVPHWVRGAKESAKLISGKESINLPFTALGGSIATDKNGLTASVIEVKSVEELKVLGADKISGKIVFFNGPMDPSAVFAFHAYGKAVGQRWEGPSEAARYGAVGTIVRSMTHSLDDYPHTGSMSYKDSIPKVPCGAISTKAADLLSAKIKSNKDVKVWMQMNCQTFPDVLSHNVIGEIRGSSKANEILLVGGHLDSWDIGDGANDDGAGIVHSMEVLHLFKTLGIKPQRTIRVVAFMNEENGLRGGKKYAELAKERNEKHIAAIESDGGSSTPRGFSMSGDEALKTKVKSWRTLLEPYGLHEFNQPGGGADIGPLKDQGVLLIGLLPDTQRYFDFHHSDNDVFENINRRELEMGAASIASLLYLLDKNLVE